MKSLALCIASAMLLAGCASRGTPPAAVAPAIGADATAAATAYAQSAASAAQFEIQSSQLALQVSQNPAVRSYAQMLINDHSQLAARLNAAAQSAGLAYAPPMMLPQHSSLLSQLQYAPPADFDSTYRNIQAMALMQSVDLHQGYATTGAVPPMRDVAAGAVPMVQMHLNQAQALTIETPRMRVPSARRAGERG